MNTVIQTSVSNGSATYDDTMQNENGFNFSTVNLSYNKVETYFSAIYCRPSKISNSYYTSITYSSFANNTAERYYCILLSYADSSANKYSVNNSNIINNQRSHRDISIELFCYL